MADSYRTLCGTTATVRKNETDQYLRVINNEISFVTEQGRLNVIQNIPAPNSPCDWVGLTKQVYPWDSFKTTTLVLTDTLDGSDGPVFLQNLDFKSTTKSTIFRCYKLPWLIQYMEDVNDDGTIEWSTTIYDGLHQKQPAQVSEVTVKKAGVKQTNCLVCHCKCSITNKGLVPRHPKA